MVRGLEKLEIAETFLNTANYLEGPYLVEGNSREEALARESKLRWESKKACHFLYSIVFELVIKIIWEVENRRECEHHHNILEFYTELSCEKQSRIEELYDTQASLVRTQEGERNGDRIRVDDLTQYQSLKEALKANYTTVTKFKYDGLYQGKSSLIGGVIWNKEIDLHWILPKRFIVFPNELLKYAREIVES